MRLICEHGRANRVGGGFQVFAKMLRSTGVVNSGRLYQTMDHYRGTL